MYLAEMHPPVVSLTCAPGESIGNTVHYKKSKHFCFGDPFLVAANHEAKSIVPGRQENVTDR